MAYPSSRISKVGSVQPLLGMLRCLLLLLLPAMVLRAQAALMQRPVLSKLLLPLLLLVSASAALGISGRT